MAINPSLSGKEIQRLVFKKLDEYKGFGYLEQYAMFMGKAQILEFGLKNLLANSYAVPLDAMKRWTLGRVRKELEQKGLRPDFIALLNSVIKYRNYIAHEMLADNAIINSLVVISPRMACKKLWKGMYELEQILILHDWCVKHNAW